MAKLTSTALYLLAIVALASCMVVVMMGASTMSSGMFIMQTSVDNHDRAVRHLRQTTVDLDGKLQSLQKAFDTQHQAIDSQAKQVTKFMEQVTAGLDKVRKDAETRQSQASLAVEEAATRHQQLHQGQQDEAERAKANRDAADAQIKELQTSLESIKSEHEALKSASQAEDLRQDLQRLRQDLDAAVQSLGKAKQHEDGPHALLAAPAPAPAESPAKVSAVASSSAQTVDYQVSWYRECGCTGMEIEAVTLLLALAERLGKGRVKTNRCTESCTWPEATRDVLNELEDEEKELWPQTDDDRPEHSRPIVLVVHAAFAGVCGSPEGLGMPFRSEGDAALEQGRGLFRVSRSMLETDKVQKDSVENCNTQFDAVWVPSGFNKRSFSESGVEKLQVLPEAVDVAQFTCKGGTFTTPAAGIAAPPSAPVERPRFDNERLDAFVDAATDNSTFTFLSIFKWEDRKNWKALFETFVRAFPENKTLVGLEDGSRVSMTVRLLVKTQELSWGTNPREDIMILLGSLGMSQESLVGRIAVITDTLPSKLVPVLYQVADAFVLPSHGEGWGLPLMEAMASGLLTIATGWGGQTEFMNSGNSWPLSYRLVELPPTDMQEVTEKQLWAEPDQGDLRKAMVEAVRRTGASREKAATACREVRERFTPTVVAAQADALLAGLAGSLLGSSDSPAGNVVNL